MDDVEFVKSSCEGNLEILAYDVCFGVVNSFTPCRVRKIKKDVVLKAIVQWITTNENSVRTLEY